MTPVDFSFLVALIAFIISFFAAAYAYFTCKEAERILDKMIKELEK